MFSNIHPGTYVDVTFVLKFDRYVRSSSPAVYFFEVNLVQMTRNIRSNSVTSNSSYETLHSLL